MGFARIDEVAYDARHPAGVYAEGWQTWSPVRMLTLGEASEQAPDERMQKVAWRPGKPVPDGLVQAEGLLVIALPEGPARAWFAPEPGREVATLRVETRGDRAVVSADGPVAFLEAASLEAALGEVGERLGGGRLKAVPPGWCSWSYYFEGVSEESVMENVEAARRLELPVQVVQVDDGYESRIGDWLEVKPAFGSLRRTAERIRGAGMRAGVWTAPFLVDPRSQLAEAHPGWLDDGVDAGSHWGQTMRILDVSQRDAASYLARVFRTFAEWGFSFYKIDFLYAGAMRGLDVFRAGLELIRESVGPEAIVLGCGAPLLPSIGLCDAMRIGPDVLQEATDPQPETDLLTRIAAMRSWMNGRLWTNDADHLVVRRQIRDRERWAAFLQDYGGAALSGDRLSELDERGLELTRRFLAAARSTSGR